LPFSWYQQPLKQPNQVRILDFIPIRVINPTPQQPIFIILNSQPPIKYHQAKQDDNGLEAVAL